MLPSTHLLHELVVGGLVEENQVVQLVPRLALRPLLLLGLATARSFLLLRRLRRGLRRALRVLFRTLQNSSCGLKIVFRIGKCNARQEHTGWVFSVFGDKLPRKGG